MAGVKISDICHVVGGIPAPNNEEAFDAFGVPFVKMKDLGRYHVTSDLKETEVKLSQEYIIKKNYKLIPKGAILLPRSSSVQQNHRAILGTDAIIASHICALVIKNKGEVNPLYLYYYLRRVDFVQISRKISGLDAIKFSDLGNVEVPLPSLEIQNRAVAILDKIQSVIEKAKQAISLSDEIIRATFLDFFGDPINNKKNWETLKLKQISKLERGRFSPRPRNNPSFFGGEYPFIQTGDINNSNYRLDSYSQTLNDKGIKVSKEFDAGDILVAIVGATIGATTILRINAYAPDSVIGIKPNNEIINNVFLEMLLRFYRRVLLRSAPRVARANINLSILRELKIIVPPINIQNQFLELSEKIEQIKLKLSKAHKAIDHLFKAISQKIFKGEELINEEKIFDELIMTFSKDDFRVKPQRIRTLVNYISNQKFSTIDNYDKAKSLLFDLLDDDADIVQVLINSRVSLKTSR